MVTKGKRSKRSYRTGDILHTEGKVMAIKDTLLVSIPKAWAVDHGIKQGDTMVKVANSMLTMVKKEDKTPE